MRVTVLGPVRAFTGEGTPIDVGGPRLRMLLARLALAAGETVPAESLVDGLWGAGPPADAAGALHALVYRLRKALGAAGTLESAGPGYRLAMRAEHVDAHRFEELATRGRRLLAANAPHEAAGLLGQALALWRGPALADVSGAPFAGPACARLTELRAQAVEDRFEVELRLGHHAEILADLDAAAAEHPLRERLAALRMRVLAAAGRQSDALAAYDEVRGRLADELGIDPSAELRDAHAEVLRGGPERPAAAPCRLPARLTSFVGRDDELTLLAELMATSRLVTLVGPGGVGKTRLAIEAATRHPAHQRGRLWLVPLAGVTGAARVADAVLGALSTVPGLPAGGVGTQPLDRAADLLGGGEAVLVLDNCEHLAGAVAEVAQRLLERQPCLTVLATSRESLEVVGEALCRVRPLDLPAPRADPAESAAVRLFVDRATAIRPGFRLDAATAGPVVEVVRRLDGLPLAVELAAARLRSMTLEQIAQRLEDRFRLLSIGNRAGEPRQRTLHAVIQWSWELLTGQERTLARRMSVFPAGAGGATVRAVCADPGTLPADDVGYVLGSLVDKSIVDESADGYRMLETIRAFAAAELDAAGERDTVSERFSRHFAELAGRHESLLRSAGQAASVRLIDTEYDNLVVALRASTGTGDAVAAIRLLGPLYWYWNVVRYDLRAETFVAEVLELGDALPADARAAFTAVHVLTASDGPPPGEARARALLEDCTRTGALRRYPATLPGTLAAGYLYGLDDLVDHEIRAVRAGADRWAHACTFLVETFACHDRGDWPGAASAAAEALRGFEEMGDRLLTAMALTAVAKVRSIDGDHGAAITAYERSIALAATGDVGYRVGLAAERMRAGDLAGARRDLEAAARAAEDRGYGLAQIEVATGLAELHRRSGTPDRSGRELDRAVTLARRLPLSDAVIEDWVTPCRMATLLAAGDAARARELLPRAVAAAFANRDVAPAAQQLAALLHLEGDPAGAATALGLSQAIRGTFDHGDPELRGLAAALAERLGRAGYDEAYRRGAELPRPDALDRLPR